MGQIINITSSNQNNKENLLTTVRKTKKLSVLQTALNSESLSTRDIESSDHSNIDSSSTPVYVDVSQLIW